MNSSDTIRLGKRTKAQLVRLKRKTGIRQWNIICRWAFAVSIAEGTTPRIIDDSFEDGIEMTWRTFAGDYTDVYGALLIQSCPGDQESADSTDHLSLLRNHISRGIGYLHASLGNDGIFDLLSLVAASARTRTDTTVSALASERSS